MGLYLGLKCLLVLVPKCPDTSDPLEHWQSVSVPICPGSEVSGYPSKIFVSPEYSPDNAESSVSHGFVGVRRSGRRRIAGHGGAAGHKDRRLVDVRRRTTRRETRVRRDAKALAGRHETPVTNQRHRSALHAQPFTQVDNATPWQAG